LVDLLNRAVRASGQSDGELGTVLNALGAASFEAGDLPGAVSLLQRAEAVLSGTERAQALYYHSRALVALGQHALALSMAKGALDGGGGAFEYQWQLARCLAANGHSEAARFAYESLRASLPPDHPYRPLVEQALEAISGPGAAP
jgi:tetratricopeptide (TPR) repeat protein